ncbi:MAG: class I SAM-dependent methyltransferase [Myxococcales bacterium]|nr:class I SAM-dependent methyltransferase [Myxococcales bacterium]
MGDSRRYLPSAGHDWLLPFYDPVLKLLGEERVKGELIVQAGIRARHRVLDIGCGTGTLAILVKRRHPGAEVVGLDPDPKALARARRKAEAAGVAIRFDEGFANELPHPDASFDRVFSSLMFHHLERDAKLATLRELRRVIAPGGSLHLLDFGPPRSRLDRALAHVFHGGDELRDNVEGKIPVFLTDAGFEGANEVGHRTTIFGGLSYWRASQPAGGGCASPTRGAGPA